MGKNNKINDTINDLRVEFRGVETMEPISEGDVIDKELLLINRIEDGFTDCESFILEGKDLDYKRFMSEVFALNGENNSYADFYYGKLKRDQKEILKQSLSKDEQQFLEKIQYEDGIYFPLTKDLLFFLLNVTLKESLFSTFYFTKFPCTIWGNYNKNFPVFFRDVVTKMKYKELAIDCNITIREL